jgi:hypothetical protein
VSGRIVASASNYVSRTRGAYRNLLLSDDAALRPLSKFKLINHPMTIKKVLEIRKEEVQ